MDPGFSKANSNNLPKIDALVLGSFFASNNTIRSAEFENDKTLKSTRPNFGDDAISFVQLMRKGKLCSMKCKVYSEVDTKLYPVTMTINEKDNVIDSVHCHDCGTSIGICSHAIAFVLWAHRKSEAPSHTSQCYWQDSVLTYSPEDFRISKIFNIKPETRKQTMPLNSSVLEKFVKEARKRNIKDCPILKYHPSYKCSETESISMHQLAIKYKEKCSHTFLEAVKKDITNEIIKKIEMETRGQHYSELWCELQYGRITASKAMAASPSNTSDENENILSIIMGEYNNISDANDKKQKNINKDLVRKTVESKLGKKIEKCGLMLNSNYPMIVGSPDGICADSIVQIKCATSTKPDTHFIKDGKPTDKYYTELQILMYLTETTNCFFCVADADYRSNQQVQIILISFSNVYVNILINILESFWKTHVYPLINQCVTVDNETILIKQE